jgi:hypothetical protein
VHFILLCFLIFFNRRDAKLLISLAAYCLVSMGNPAQSFDSLLEKIVPRRIDIGWALATTTTT